VLLILLQDLFSPRHIEQITYSEFKTLLKAGKVEDVVLTERTASGALRPEALEGILQKERSSGFGKRAVTSIVSLPCAWMTRPWSQN
jgi:cell division protease FtsH